MLRSANPALRALQPAQTWDDAHGKAPTRAASNTMTIRGTVMNTSILLGICAAAAVGAWNAALNPGTQSLTWPLFFGGLIGGVILSLVIMFKPRTAPFLAPVYAGLEGLVLGIFSVIVGERVSAQVGEQVGPTLVLQAIGLTMTVTAAMLAGYAFGIIRPGKVFRAVVLSAAGGLGIFIIIAFVMHLFGNSTLLSVYDSTNGSLLSVGFSLFVVGLASLFLVLDFQFIDEASRSGAPKYMEWVGAFALLMTLVWLYIEILRLLAKLRSSD